MTTRRERMEARAGRREDWAGGRREKAAALHKQDEHYRGDYAFNTQPGHIPERARVNARSQRAFEHSNVAESHDAKAVGIRRALCTSIFSDDTDARERMEAKIVKMEAQRDCQKAANAAYRKEHRAALKAMTKYERDCAVPFPPYSLTNLGTNIRRFKQRLAALDQPAVIRTIEARRGGDCDECSEPIEAGTLISKVEGVWIHAHHTERITS